MPFVSILVCIMPLQKWETQQFSLMFENFENSSLYILTTETNFKKLLLNTWTIMCSFIDQIIGHACRVLKDVKLNTVPKIRKVEFTHCAKLIEENLAYEVALQEDTLPNGQAKRYNKAVFLRPMHQVTT